MSRQRGHGQDLGLRVEIDRVPEISEAEARAACLTIADYAVRRIDDDDEARAFVRDAIDALGLS